MAWPTTNDPKTEFATLRMTVSEAADLDDAALRAGVKRSEYIRRAVENQIARDQKASRRKSGKINLP